MEMNYNDVKNREIERVFKEFWAEYKKTHKHDNFFAFVENEKGASKDLFFKFARRLGFKTLKHKNVRYISIDHAAGVDVPNDDTNVKDY